MGELERENKELHDSSHKREIFGFTTLERRFLWWIYDYKILYHILTTAKIVPVDTGEEDVAFNPLKLQAVASICEQLPYQVLYLSTRLNVGRKLQTLLQRKESHPTVAYVL